MKSRGAIFRLASLFLAVHSTITMAQEKPTPPPTFDVLTKEEAEDAKGTIDRQIRQAITDFNAAHRDTWSKVQTRDQWEKYRDERIAKLRQSLGDWPKSNQPNVKITNVIRGEGYRLENLVYETRPGFWVTGNLYVPAKLTPSMPGILIAHAHHGGKRDSELQDMGMTWARAGCLVLVIDQVNYGERRSHPFHRDSDYAKPYRASRQDYYFRYDTGIQLQLLGDSLMGWMACDLMRGVDVLLAREGCDPKRIAVLGAVAGGGDPAGVTAALDSRITCCVPFNFGGPQPETKYPLPDDAETSFNYLLFTYWDSTRGLRLGAKQDFPHWVITASIAPRYLIHGHEFAWDGERDPVWKRYQKVWGEFYKAPDHVGVAHGKGGLKLRPPEGTHCNNIGEYHRRMIHPLFEKWFGIKAVEFHAPRQAAELTCWTENAKAELRPKSLNEVMNALASARLEEARVRRTKLSPEERRKSLQEPWAELLGPTTVKTAPVVKGKTMETRSSPAWKVERITLETEPGIIVPLVLLLPPNLTKPVPVVVGVAQAGKAGFLKERREELEKIVQAGAIVALPDLRGTGESRSGSSRGRDSGDTNRSVHVQLFGETMLGQRLRDVRAVLAYLRTRNEVNPRRLALWGDSFAQTNSDQTDFKVPHGVDGWPVHAEPLGQMVSLLAGLYEEDVKSVFIAGGLNRFQDVLTHFAVLVPHDIAVPGMLRVGDISDLAAAFAPRPLHLEAMVDHLNRRVSLNALEQAYQPTKEAYGSAATALSFSEDRTSAAAWLLKSLR